MRSRVFGGQRTASGATIREPSALVSETDSLTSPELDKWVRLAMEGAPGVCLYLPSLQCDYKYMP